MSNESGKLKLGKVWAILIGINDYPLPDALLTGCVWDVEAMEFLLSELFPASRLKIFKLFALNSEGGDRPTYDNIVKAIDTF